LGLEIFDVHFYRPCDRPPAGDAPLERRSLTRGYKCLDSFYHPNLFNGLALPFKGGLSKHL
jgi:hypothetical protein